MSYVHTSKNPTLAHLLPSSFSEVIRYAAVAYTWYIMIDHVSGNDALMALASLRSGGPYLPRADRPPV